MEKMIKFSRIGYGFSKVLKIMAWVGCGLLLASLVFIVCTKDTSGLIYRGDNMHVSVYAPVSWKNYSLAQAITAISIASTGLVLLGFIFRELEFILVGMKDGETPFTMDNVHHLRMIALYMLLALVLGEIVESVLTGILNCEVNEEALGSILSVIIVYALSFVFEYGVKLQEQVDETL